jgi:hypothetical protein
MALASCRHITSDVHILRAMRGNCGVHTEHFSSIYLQNMIVEILAFEKKMFRRTFGQM